MAVDGVMIIKETFLFREKCQTNNGDKEVSGKTYLPRVHYKSACSIRGAGSLAYISSSIVPIASCIIPFIVSS